MRSLWDDSEIVFEKLVAREGGPQMLGGARACP